MPPYQQFPNSYGRPDTVLRSAYTPGDGVLHVRDLPIGIAHTGPVFQLKVGSTLYKVTDLGAYPHLDWLVPDGAVELTADHSHPSGTAVYLELTEAAIEYVLARTYLTRDDETANGLPNSVPADSLSLRDFASASHNDLTEVDPNEHHMQYHDHSSDLDSQSLFPNILFVQQQFALSGRLVVPEITADQDDFQPDGGDEATYWFMTSDAARNITGIAMSEIMGYEHVLLNKGAFNIVLKHQDGGSFPDHQFSLPGGVDYTLGPGHSVKIWYDADDQYVRVLA